MEIEEELDYFKWKRGYNINAIIPKVFLMKSLCFALVILCMALSVCKSTHAEIIAQESFNYDFGGILVQVPGTGTGFTTNWVQGGRNTSSSAFRVQSGSLSFSGVNSIGNAVSAPFSNSGIFGAHRQTSQFIVGASTGQTSWMSFLIRQNEVGGQFGGFGGIYIGNSTNESDPKLFVGKGGAGSNNWLLENLGGTNQVQSNSLVTTGQTALLVLKMETRVGNDRFTLFVNPTSQTEPTVGFVKTDLDLVTANRITMYHSGAFSFDEIRIGTSFADVVTAVPEPSSTLLMLAGAVGAIWRRRVLALKRNRVGLP